MAEHAHLQIRRPAEIVDEQGHRAGRGNGAGKPLRHHRRDLARQGQLDPLDSGFAVDAEAEFRLSRVQPCVRRWPGIVQTVVAMPRLFAAFAARAASAATRSSGAPASA